MAEGYLECPYDLSRLVDKTDKLEEVTSKELIGMFLLALVFKMCGPLIELYMLSRTIPRGTSPDMSDSHTPKRFASPLADPLTAADTGILTSPDQPL